METTIKETTDTNAKETTKPRWTFKQFVNALFRRKTNLDKLKEIDELQPSHINSKILEQKPIPNAPFTAVKFENKWFLALGKYRLTNQLNSYQECVAEAQDASWIRLFQVIRIMIKEYELEKQLEETVKKQTQFPKTSQFEN